MSRPLHRLHLLYWRGPQLTRQHRPHTIDTLCVPKSTIRNQGALWVSHAKNVASHLERTILIPTSIISIGHDCQLSTRHCLFAVIPIEASFGPFPHLSYGGLHWHSQRTRLSPYCRASSRSWILNWILSSPPSLLPIRFYLILSMRLQPL